MHDRIFGLRDRLGWSHWLRFTVSRDGLREPCLECLFNRFHKYQGLFAPNCFRVVWKIFLVCFGQHDSAKAHAMGGQELFFDAADWQHEST
jgi:hypothetical protein